MHVGQKYLSDMKPPKPPVPNSNLAQRLGLKRVLEFGNFYLYLYRNLTEWYFEMSR